jgi:hypothetical protein
VNYFFDLWAMPINQKNNSHVRKVLFIPQSGAIYSA